VGEEGDGVDDGVFVPLSPFYGGGPASRRERGRERHLAEHAGRARERGGRRPGGRARGLSRADIVAAAIAIADAEGTDAVSIRRIARDLRAGAMSLYWHVASTEELHQLMVEEVQSEIRAPEPSGDWRADLRVYAGNSRAALLRHPWAIDFLGIGPPAGPYDARNGERLLTALDGLGLDLTTTVWGLLTIGTYVMGAAMRDIQEMRWQQASADRTAGLTEAEVAGHVNEFGRRIRESGRYPHLTRILDAGFDPDAAETRDDRFEFGLNCVLDGIAARISAAGQPGAAAEPGQLKWTLMVPKFCEGFSIRMFLTDERFCSRNRSTCFFS
jgi:AcrR family transcriptional regulator